MTRAVAITPSFRRPARSNGLVSRVQAIIRSAQVRTAFDHLARNFDLGLAWIVAPLLDSAPRVFRNAAGFRRVSIVLLREPVGGPFPYIADHVVNAVTVRRERGHRGSPLETVAVQILPRKIALPGVGVMLSAGHEFTAPGIFSVVDSAARRELPFGFGRQNPRRPNGRRRTRLKTRRAPRGDCRDC